MSKIEEALRKARSVGTLRGRPIGSSTALRPVTTDDSVVSTPVDSVEEVLVSANKQLARMGDSWFLTEVERADNRIIHPEMKDEQVANAFRDLRTKILDRSGNRNCSILVCGVTEQCGASFVAMNLSVAFSFDESRTALLIDGNIGDPAFGKLLKDSRAPHGITDYFERDDIKIEQIIHPIGIRKLRLIPAGTMHKGSAEYFTSRKVRSLLKGAQQRYPDRYIVISAPPVANSADTRILANMVDLVLLVVAYGKTTEQQIVTAARAVKPDKLLGLVFNDEPRLPKLNWKDELKKSLYQLLRSLVPVRKSSST
jgi:protein-tyrosine kinase